MPNINVLVVNIEADLRDHTVLIIILTSCVVISILIAITFYCYIRKLVCFAPKAVIEIELT